MSRLSIQDLDYGISKCNTGTDLRNLKTSIKLSDYSDLERKYINEKFDLCLDNLYSKSTSDYKFNRDNTNLQNDIYVNKEKGKAFLLLIGIFIFLCIGVLISKL